MNSHKIKREIKRNDRWNCFLTNTLIKECNISCFFQPDCPAVSCFFTSFFYKIFIMTSFPVTIS